MAACSILVLIVSAVVSMRPLGVASQSIAFPDDTSLVGHWDFVEGALHDSTGNWGETQLVGSTFGGTFLQVAGSGLTSTARATASGYSGPDLGSHTIVSRFIFNGNGGREGSPAAIVTSTGEYDAIQFGDGSGSTSWILGSNGDVRTAPAGDRNYLPWNYQQEVTVAIVVLLSPEPTTNVKVYVDGMLRLSYTRNTGFTFARASGLSMVWGTRDGTNGALDANILETRLYSRALQEYEIAPLKPKKVSTAGNFLRFHYEPGFPGFDRAKKACWGHGAYLALYTNDNERDEMLEANNDSTKLVYLGGSDAGDEKRWKFMDGPREGDEFFDDRCCVIGKGCKVDRCYWMSGEPNNSGNQDYLWVPGNTFQWDDNNLQNAYGWLCQRSPQVASVGRYKVFSRWKKNTMEKSSYLCAAYGGWIATITRTEEWEAVRSVLEPSVPYIMSGSDAAAEGVWRWTRGPKAGTLFYNHQTKQCYQQVCPWAANEPNNDCGTGCTESSTEAFTTGWNDQKPDGNRGTICEFARTVTASMSGTLSIPPTATASNSTTITPPPTPTNSPTSSSSNSASLTLSPMPSNTLTASPTGTRSVTISKTPVSTRTGTSSTSITPSDSRSISLSLEPTTSEAPTETNTRARSASLTLAPTLSVSRSVSESAAASPSPSLVPTRSRSFVPSRTLSALPSSTLQRTFSNSGSATPSSTHPTLSVSATFTAAVSNTVSVALLATPSRSATVDFFEVWFANASSIQSSVVRSGSPQRLPFIIRGDRFDPLTMPLNPVALLWCTDDRMATIRNSSAMECTGCVAYRGSQIGAFENATDPLALLADRGNITVSALSGTEATLTVHGWPGFGRLDDAKQLTLHLALVCVSRRRPFPELNFTVEGEETEGGVPEEVYEGSKVGGEVAVTASGIGSPAIAGQMGRSTLALKLADCEPDVDEPLDTSQHPFKFGVGSSPLSYFVGGALFNPVACICFGTFLFLLGIGYSTCRGTPILHGFEFSRFPSLVSFPLMLLVEPTCMCAVMVITQADDYLRYLGIVSLTICWLCPLLTGIYLYRKRREFVYHDNWSDTENAAGQKGCFKVYLFGLGKWTDRDGPHSTGFCQRNRLLFDDFTGKYYWFLCVEMVVSMICGCLDGVKLGPGRCTPIIVTVIVTFLIFIVVLLVCRPYGVPFLQHFAVLMTVLQLAATVAVASEVLYGYEYGEELAEWFSVTCMWLLMLRTLYDIGPKGYRWWKGVMVAVGKRKRPVALKPALANPNSSAARGRGLSEHFNADLHRQLHLLTLDEDDKANVVEVDLLAGVLGVTEADEEMRVVHKQRYPGDDTTDGYTPPSADAVGLPHAGGDRRYDYGGLLDGLDNQLEGDDEEMWEYDEASGERRFRVKGNAFDLNDVLGGLDRDVHPAILAMRRRRAARERRQGASSSRILARMIDSCQEGDASLPLFQRLHKLVATAEEKLNAIDEAAALRQARDSTGDASAVADDDDTGADWEPLMTLGLADMTALDAALAATKSIDGQMLSRRLAKWPSTPAPANATIITQMASLRDEAVSDEQSSVENLLSLHLERAGYLASLGGDVTNDVLVLASISEFDELLAALHAYGDESLGATILAKLLEGRHPRNQRRIQEENGSSSLKKKSSLSASSRTLQGLDLDMDLDGPPSISVHATETMGSDGIDTLLSVPSVKIEPAQHQQRTQEAPTSLSEPAATSSESEAQRLLALLLDEADGDISDDDEDIVDALGHSPVDLGVPHPQHLEEGTLINDDEEDAFFGALTGGNGSAAEPVADDYFHAHIPELPLQPAEDDYALDDDEVIAMDDDEDGGGGDAAAMLLALLGPSTSVPSESTEMQEDEFHDDEAAFFPLSSSRAHSSATAASFPLFADDDL